jgi:hypothetical protein
MTSGI